MGTGSTIVHPCPSLLPCFPDNVCIQNRFLHFSDLPSWSDAPCRLESLKCGKIFYLSFVLSCCPTHSSAAGWDKVDCIRRYTRIFLHGQLTPCTCLPKRQQQTWSRRTQHLARILCKVFLEVLRGCLRGTGTSLCLRLPHNPTSVTSGWQPAVTQVLCHCVPGRSPWHL